MAIKKIIKARKTSKCVTRAAFMCNMDEIAELVVKYHAKKAALEKALEKVNDQYAGDLKEIEDKIYDLRDASEEYFLEHQEELCKPGQREGESTLALFGIRLGQPTVVKTVKTAFKTLAAKWAEGSNVLSQFVRRSYDVDKEQILAAFRDKEQLTAQNALLKAGVNVEQKDEFWIKAKAEEQAN